MIIYIYIYISNKKLKHRWYCRVTCGHIYICMHFPFHQVTKLSWRYLWCRSTLFASERRYIAYLETSGSFIMFEIIKINIWVAVYVCACSLSLVGNLLKCMCWHFTSAGINLPEQTVRSKSNGRFFELRWSRSRPWAQAMICAGPPPYLSLSQLS